LEQPVYPLFSWLMLTNSLIFPQSEAFCDRKQSENYGLNAETNDLIMGPFVLSDWPQLKGDSWKYVFKNDAYWIRPPSSLNEINTPKFGKKKVGTGILIYMNSGQLDTFFFNLGKLVSQYKNNEWILKNKI